MPIVAKGMGLGAVILDIYFSTRLSMIFCWCPLIPAIVSVVPSSGYGFIKINPPCLAIFVGISELMFMLRLNGIIRTSYSTIFVTLFYYFLVTMFFTIISFLTAVFKFFIAIFTRFRGFNMRLFTIQFFLGGDNIMAVVLLMMFSNWLFYDETVKSFDGEMSRGTFDMKNMSDYDRAISQRESTWAAAKTVSIICAIYVLIRNCAVFYATKDEMAIHQLVLLRRNAGFETGAGASPNLHGGQTNVPRVEKPSTTQNILNLFRINANYYSENNPNSNTQEGRPQEPAVSTPSQNQSGKLKPQDKQDSPDEKDNLCSICMAEPSNCIILPCRHGGICKGCTMDMMKKSVICPFCRKNIDKVCVVLKINDNQYQIVEEIKI